jgi:hypothetical protein
MARRRWPITDPEVCMAVNANRQSEVNGYVAVGRKRLDIKLGATKETDETKDRKRRTICLYHGCSLKPQTYQCKSRD